MTAQKTLAKLAIFLAVAIFSKESTAIVDNWPEKNLPCSGCVLTDEKIAVEGKITFSEEPKNTWLALIETKKGFFKLAFPPEFYSMVNAWNGKTVSLKGRILRQPRQPLSPVYRSNNEYVPHPTDQDDLLVRGIDAFYINGRKVPMFAYDKVLAIYVSCLYGDDNTWSDNE